MSHVLLRLAPLGVMLFALPARAGVYYSGESVAELPSQWRGFLLDHRGLRGVGQKPDNGMPASRLRRHYEKIASGLEKSRRERVLSAGESADLGALYIRLGESARAVEVLRDSQRRWPGHFAILSNLGTAWQLQGDLQRAVQCLGEAVPLAPATVRRAEEWQLKLARLRYTARATDQELEHLFGVRFVGNSGEYEPGRM